MQHYIYVDDMRTLDKCPDGWRPHVVRTYEDTIDLILAILYSGETASFILDLDHDLGETKSGYDICKWVVENQLPLVGFHIHSMNPVGVMNMRQLLTHYGYSEI